MFRKQFISRFKSVDYEGKFMKVTKLSTISGGIIGYICGIGISVAVDEIHKAPLYCVTCASIGIITGYFTPLICVTVIPTYIISLPCYIGYNYYTKNK